LATSDGSGRFAFAEAWTGTYQLTAAARGFRGARSRPFTLAAGQRHEVELRLGEGGITLSGQVLDEGSGPIPGAVVTAGMGYPWNSTPGVPRLDRQFVAIADDDGRYQLTLEPREYRLRVQAAGYVPAETSVAVTRPVTRDLRLGPAARISGRVVERASGQPVADAEVILSGSSRDFANHRNTRTDDQGRFVIDDASAGAFELSARHRDRKLFGRGAKVVTIATQAIEGQAARARAPATAWRCAGSSSSTICGRRRRARRSRRRPGTRARRCSR
jgi:hypothetical protein